MEYTCRANEEIYMQCMLNCKQQMENITAAVAAAFNEWEYSIAISQNRSK